MINLKVYNLKSVLRKILKLCIGIFVIVFLMNFVSNKVQVNIIKSDDNFIKKGIIEKGISEISNETLNMFFGKSLSTISVLNKNEEKSSIHIAVKDILKYELGTLNKIIENEVLNVNEVDLTNDDKEELLGYETVEPQVQQTQVEEKFSNEYESVRIKNTSNYEITEDILNMAKNEEYIYSRNVMIFHTHTCESYTPSDGYKYQFTGNYRTTDLNFSVARVGDELEKHLKDLKFNVIHDKTYHDFPAYSGSYTRSYDTVNKLITENNGYDIIFDIHRDAIGNNGEYAPIVKIGEEYVAQLMFVVGTDAGGLEHPDWQKNLSFAIKVQKKANELYPGLFKPIMLSNSRFNQNLARGACIIEVGATGNILEQSINSMKYLSIVLDNVI